MNHENQQTLPVPDQPPVKTSNNLSFLKALAYGFVIVSVGILIAVVGYLLGANKNKIQPIVQTSVTPSVNPTSNSTTSWKTYISNKYGFSFKYPSIFTENPTLSNLTYQGINLADLSNGKANSLKINIYPSLKNYRLVDNPGGFAFYFDVSSRQWMHDKTIETSKFTPQKTNSTIESYIYNTGDVKCGQEYILIPASNDTSIIELINEKCSDDSGSNLPEYYNLKSTEILSTFKFIDQNQVDPTANWKTYSSQNYGFEIKYPSDWNHSSDVMEEVFAKEYVKDSTDFSCVSSFSVIPTDNFDNYMKSYYASFQSNPKQSAVNINGINAINMVGLPYSSNNLSYWIKRPNGKNFSVQISQQINKIITNKDGKVQYGYVDDSSCIDIFNQILSTFKFIN